MYTSKNAFWSVKNCDGQVTRLAATVVRMPSDHAKNSDGNVTEYNIATALCVCVCVCTLVNEWLAEQTLHWEEVR